MVVITGLPECHSFAKHAACAVAVFLQMVRKKKNVGISGLGTAASTEFLPVDLQTVAEAIAAAGVVDEATGALSTADPLEQIQRVRVATAGGG